MKSVQAVIWKLSRVARRKGWERNAEHFGWLFRHCGDGLIVTPPKTHMDTQNDGLEKVTPFKNGNFWDINVRVLECTRL